jgi:hypothetical protein
MPRGYAVMKMEDGLPPSNGGQVAYSDLSGVSHGVLFALVSRLEVHDERFGNYGHFASPSMKAETIAPLVGVMMRGFINCVDREIEVYGWEAPEWAAWRRQAEVTVDRLIEGE